MKSHLSNLVIINLSSQCLEDTKNMKYTGEINKYKYLQISE